VLPPPQFLAGSFPCFRPSATTLTSLETNADALSVDIPPLYDHLSYDNALRAGHGKYKFSSDNEVLFFGNEVTDDGYVGFCSDPNFAKLNGSTSGIVRREIRPSSIAVGQIAQIKVQFRLLKQENGTFTFRELLKGIYVVNDGLSMVCFCWCCSLSFNSIIENFA
jgi:hypothetical protein